MWAFLNMHQHFDGYDHLLGRFSRGGSAGNRAFTSGPACIRWQVRAKRSSRLRKKPVAEKPAVEAPAVEAPAVEAPAVEAPAVEAPAVEAPAVEAPAVEAPAAEEPAAEEPAVEEPAAEEPAGLLLRMRAGLAKTQASFVGRIDALLRGRQGCR